MHIQPSRIDYAVLILDDVFVLWSGSALRHYIRTTADDRDPLPWSRW